MRSSGYRETLINLQRESLSRLRISQSKRFAELRRRSGGWEVMLKSGRAVPADTQQVEEIVDLLERIKPARIQAKTRAAWPSLLLDTAGIRVEAFEGEEKTLDIIIGKTEVVSNRGYQTYVRLEDDSVSYVAAGISGFGIQPRANAYRPIWLFNAETDSVSSIQLEDLSTGEQLILQKEDSLWFISTDPPQVIDTDLMWRYLGDISELSSNEFDDEFSFTEKPLRRVSLFLGSTRQTVDFYRGGDDWVLRSSINQNTSFRDSVAAAQLWKSSDFFLDSLP